MATKEKKVKRKKRGPTRIFSTDFSKYSAYLCIVIGDYPDVESTVYVLYHNLITMHDGDDLRFGDPAPLKTMYVEDPIDYFNNLCSLAKLMDGDNLREYIVDNGKDSSYAHTVNTLLRSRGYDLGNLIDYTGRIVSRLRAEVEDYMTCSGTPWRRFKTALRRIICPRDYLPKARTKSKK